MLHSCETKPIAADRQTGPSPRPEPLTLPPPRGTSAPNKANSAQKQVRRRAGKAVGPPTAATNRAKQSQFGRKRQTGQVLLGKRVVVNCTCIGPWQNKANSRRCRVGRGLGDEGRGTCTNKANSQGGRAGQRGVAWAYCAKQSQFATNRQARLLPRPEALTLPPVRGQACQTKPIRPEASDRASPVGKRSCGELYMHRPMAKQSQFPAVPGGARPGRRGPWDLYKQSQFPRETPASGESLGHIAPNKANLPRLSLAEDPVTIPAARIL